VSRRVRWRVVALGVAAGAVLVAHLSPLVAWHFGLARYLAARPAAHRLRSPVADAFPEVPGTWQARRLGDLRVALPPDAVGERGCDDSGQVCFLQWSDASLSVLPEGQIEPYAEMLDFRAPDERDLSPWRSAWANWETVGALWTFVTTSRAKLDSYRFAHAGAKGVVVRSLREGRSRWVVAAYAPDESAARGLAVAGFGEPDFQALLGSVDLRPAGSDASGPVR